jgi:hypothetical protein
MGIKRIVLLFTILCASALNAMEVTKPEGFSGEHPYIILYMDINKTIIVESQRKGFDFEKGLAALLATAPEYAHTWGDESEKMSYCKWVDEKLFPESKRDPVLKKQCEAYHAGFVEAAKSEGHPLSQEIAYEFESLVNSLKAQQPRGVFTSFSNLIKYLKERNYSFSIVLRTFGKDLDWVSQELSQDGLNFIYGSFSKGVLNLNNKVISNPAEMIAAFEPGKNYAIQDNYDWWKQHNFTDKGGKPFPVDVCDKHVLSIFFDDNANEPGNKKILNIMPVGEETNLNELIAMGRIVHVDTRKAILDKNYFITAVEKALKNWREIGCQQAK